jgi:PTS system cellobiose-specific IIA component
MTLKGMFVLEEQGNLQVVMELIIHGGGAKSNAMEAIQAAKAGDFELAGAKVSEAEASLVKAHNSQTEMLAQEAQGAKVEVSLLMVHGQDHLMTSMAFVDLAKEIIDLYKKIDGK